MPKFESLGDRMKFYEGVWGGVSQLMPLIPAIVRLDGKAFHSFTRGLAKPFDMGLIDLMIETTKFLVEETNACIGYTQSDEITLILMSESFDSQIYFDGRVDKINSILAGRCATYFNNQLPFFLPSKVGQVPVFDCRCFNVPNEQEAVNALVWREQDATRNSVQMAGQCCGLEMDRDLNAAINIRKCGLKILSDGQEYTPGDDWRLQISNNQCQSQSQEKRGMLFNYACVN